MKKSIDMAKALDAAWFKFLKEQPDDEVRRRFAKVRRVCWMGWDKLNETEKVDAMRIHFWQTPGDWHED